MEVLKIWRSQECLIISKALAIKHRGVDPVALSVYWRAHLVAMKTSAAAIGEKTRMKVVGQVNSLWRYPVKSMRGEELQEVFVGFSGVYGDRLYAFHSSAARKGFPFFTGREQEQMLLHRATYRNADIMAKPPNLAEAEGIPPGATPVYAGASDLMVDVQTPDGESFAIDDPRLISKLREGIKDRHELSLHRSDRAMTDCRPVSLFSTKTAKKLGQELGSDVDKRRFRANIYLDLGSDDAFSEDEFVGHQLRIGEKTVIAVTDQDPRCKMITLDPDSAEATPELMRLVSESHDGKVGIYGAVVTEGVVRQDDEVVLLD